MDIHIHPDNENTPGSAHLQGLFTVIGDQIMFVPPLFSAKLTEVIQTFIPPSLKEHNWIMQMHETLFSQLKHLLCTNIDHCYLCISFLFADWRRMFGRCIDASTEASRAARKANVAILWSNMIHD